ncbi:amidohydrolase family protein [Pedobacter sp. KR3-3]|uniref:Amidohydrolase family protein n=1 Tax=Pedobacter albus TaxID=3113905 RepID=A0ABU7I475_9SPHI|nr:amidohydrolase family protein [Pedobacter sp. KR3-3]MEE1944262.1 amidohydrolase family protein [Pedobacter sp. KR3-3]
MIDSHVHFWQFDPVKDAWINEEMAVLQRDFSPADYCALQTENGIDGCIAVQADQSEQETAFLVDLAKHNPIIKGVVGWVDLKSKVIEEKLSFYAKEPMIKGWRHIVQAENEGFLLQPEFIRGVRALKNHGYTYDILVKHNQLPEVMQFIDQLGEQPLVIDHCAKPDLNNKDISAWTAQLKTIAQASHVYCKLSGLLTEGDWNNPDKQLIFKCLDVVFESFGTDRLLFGSDWPVMLLSKKYSYWMQMVGEYMQQFSKQEQQLVFGDNAIKFYKLD